MAISARFKFRLEKVLEYREEQEAAAQNKLACTRETLRQSMEKLSVLKRELEDLCRDEGAESTRVDVNQLLAQTLYAEVLSDRITFQEQVVRHNEEEVQKDTEQLIEKMRERKVLSNLKDKRKMDFYLEQKALEQKAYDEFAVLQYARRT